MPHVHHLNYKEKALIYLSRDHFFHWSDKALKTSNWLYSAHAADEHQKT